MTDYSPSKARIPALHAQGVVIGPKRGPAPIAASFRSRPSPRAQQYEPEGRASLRHRTTVEHSLARIEQIQGSKARYKGTRKNTLDLRRVAAVANLQRIARLPKAA